jgi:hypothetical protein
MIDTKWLIPKSVARESPYSGNRLKEDAERRRCKAHGLNLSGGRIAAGGISGKGVPAPA